jgi:hypothetical protein
MSHRYQAYTDALGAVGIDWAMLRDDAISGLSRDDIAQAAYVYLLDHPGRSAGYAIAAVLGAARRRAAIEVSMPEVDAEREVEVEPDDHIDIDVPPPVEAAAAILRGGTGAAAAALRLSRRRVQQMLARDPLALAQRLAASSAQAALV